MEKKTIDFDYIAKIVKTAMELGLEIRIVKSIWETSNAKFNSIGIFNTGNRCCTIECINSNINISTGKFGYFVVDNINERDILRFKSLILDIKEYNKNRVFKDIEELLDVPKTVRELNDIEIEE